MKVHIGCRFPNGVYYFRCVIRVHLLEPLFDESPDADEPHAPAIGFYRTYGVVARDLADAAAQLEKELRRIGDDETPSGHLVELEMVVIDPRTLEVDRLNGPPDKRGIRFVSGRVFYTAENDDPEEDGSLGETDEMLH